MTLRWTSQLQSFEVTVPYCVYREIGYFAGIDFKPGVKWSQTLFHPQHLFDPSSLLRKGEVTLEMGEGPDAGNLTIERKSVDPVPRKR